MGALFIVNGCSRNALDYYKDTTPQADIKDYFNGHIKAWGIVQSWSGYVIRRFEIDMVGKWEGNIGKLVEHFDYYDGEKHERIWTIKKLANGSYEGTASDIVDKAIGRTEGSAIYWNYIMNLPVKGKTYKIKFDDWMWTMKDQVLINRSYLKKFGITVAEVTVFMQKQKL
ncbi:hypothetical protein B488_01960 [Liberibacter crescens BT-1]|uniref:Lipoprotein n=2 Tax=Liberibacter crescens TaxID=1273132 RepID=L0ERR6_LIBCB|nr:hypothetical protein B488_01960 [Liberibacter crescens BT-1]